jgi:hypothetical protein
MKDILVFDTTEIDSSDQVGSYIFGSGGNLVASTTINSIERLAVDSTLKDGAGTALTSTLIGAKQALDVYIAEGINVEVDLSHLDDSVRLGDGANFFTSTTIGADIGLDVNIINTITANDMALASAVNTALTHQTEATLPTAANRKYLFIYNNGNKKLFVGNPTGLDVDNGFPISPGSYLELRAGPDVALGYIRPTGGTSDLRVLELT